MYQDAEKTAYQRLQSLVGSFEYPTITKKSIEVSPGIELSFALKERTSARVLLLMEAIEKKVQVFACQVAAYPSGFLRGLTVEQFGVVRKKADLSTEAGWRAQFEINAFLVEWLSECCQALKIENLKAKAVRRVA